jgi:hypothetical protein
MCVRPSVGRCGLQENSTLCRSLRTRELLMGHLVTEAQSRPRTAGFCGPGSSRGSSPAAFKPERHELRWGGALATHPGNPPGVSTELSRSGCWRNGSMAAWC